MRAAAIERQRQAMGGWVRNVGKSAMSVGTGRYFSVAQADRSLVLVKRIVADVITLHRRLLELQAAYDAAEARDRPDELEAAKDQLFETGRRLRACLIELEEVGAELKDWSLGIVDFPCIAGGGEVRLCWRWGERAVEHWHDVGDGFAGRRPIDSLPKSPTHIATSQPRPAAPGTPHWKAQ